METQASRPSADVLRLIAKNLSEMVLAYGMDRNLVFVNPAAESLTGYSMEELEHSDFLSWTHPDDLSRMQSLWEGLFHGRSFHEEEYRLVTRDGRVKWVVSSWTPILDDTGTQVGVQGRSSEITRRKLAEAAQRHSQERLRADEERYRNLFENSPFPMWEEDFSEVRRYLDSLIFADLREHLQANAEAVGECIRRVQILDVNRAAREFYGAASKEELLGGLARLFDERACEVFCEEIVALWESSSYRTEFAVRTLNDDERLVDMIVSVVDSARHDWSRVIVSFFDVTDRKRLEEQVVQSQKMESMGRLAGGVAHDFNNLLTVINGYSDWILREMQPDNPFRRQLSEIRSAGEQCAELTRQLLSFSRKHIVRPGPLDLNQLIRESSPVLGRLLGDDIEICTELAGDLGTVHGDRGQMQQVLMNLAVNARDAMPGGGTLTITTRTLGEPPEILLEVRDTGLGMEESVRRHVFEPFFTSKKGEKNTGLGLSIVFGIVSQSGGRIQVDSEPGAGASFRIYLPQAAGQSIAVEPPPPVSERPHPGGGIVLVVDDREEVRILTCRMLQQLGYEAIPASSGAEALVLASVNQPIPVLLTDVVMPGMNGRELAAQLQQRYPQMKAIFMSGYTDHILADSGTLDSPAAYLQKPFTLAQLGEILRHVTAAA